MGIIKQPHVLERQRRQPLYKCMVKMAVACLKRRPRATRRQIECKVMNIYKKQGFDHFKLKKSIRPPINELIKMRCIKKHGPWYQIVSACAREELRLHKRRRSQSRSRTKNQSRSRSKRKSRSHSRSRSRSRSGGSIRWRRGHIRRRRRHRRPIMHHQRHQGCKPNVVHCPIANTPICAPICAPICNPIYKFPFRDAMIIVATVLVSYWMQQRASKMQGLGPTSME